MIKKLRIKFVLIMMTIFTIMLTIILSMIIQFTKMNMEQISIQTLNQLATNPLLLIRPADDINTYLPYFSLRLDENGAIAETISNYNNFSDSAYLQQIVNESIAGCENMGVLEKYNLRFVRVTTTNEQLFIFADISNETATLQTLTRNCLVIGIFSFIVFFGISILFANWAVSPIEKAWEQQKRFVADASHKLKTPLTIISTNAELIQSAELNGDKKAKFADIIQTTAAHMCNLVEGMLELSRIDNGLMKTNMSTLDFGLLTQKNTYIFEPLYYERELTLHSEIATNVFVKGSEYYLNQVLEILLDNAMKYAYSNTEITLKLMVTHTGCLLSVSNHGNALSPEDLKNIFKRFYRADKNQNVSGSYGLGLSIAKSILDEHRGKIWAEYSDEIITFFVRIPTVSQ